MKSSSNGRSVHDVPGRFLEQVERIAREKFKGHPFFAVWRFKGEHPFWTELTNHRKAILIGMPDEAKPNEPSAMICLAVVAYYHLWGASVELLYQSPRPPGEDTTSRSLLTHFKEGCNPLEEVIDCLNDLADYR